MARRIATRHFPSCAGALPSLRADRHASASKSAMESDKGKPQEYGEFARSGRIPGRSVMTFRLSEPIVDRLLDKLCTDDAFRALFADDARAALASLGHSPASDPSIVEGAWWCLKVESLASKEVIRQSRNELRRQFTMSFLPQLPFALDAQWKEQDQAA
jgi:putative modified peptide